MVGSWRPKDSGRWTSGRGRGYLAYISGTTFRD